jgi:hypothetical protein
MGRRLYAGHHFDEGGPGAHLAEATRRVLKASYARFLSFLSDKHRDRLSLLPEQRVDLQAVADYVGWRRRHREDIVLAVELNHLRQALRLICPSGDWSWVSIIANRISATATRKAPRHGQITSERLLFLGIQLMDQAVAQAEAAGGVSKEHAIKYRDGLIIAILAFIPLRRRTFVAFRFDKHLIKTGTTWSLDIPTLNTKTKRALDYPIWERRNSPLTSRSI